MRVLQIISTIGYYGSESVVSALCSELRSRNAGLALCILTSRTQRSRALIERAVETGIPSLEICCDGRLDWQAIRSLRRFIRDQKITVIHSHNYKSNFYALLASLGLNVQLVSTCHNWAYTTRNLRIYAALDRRVLRHFSRVAAVSQQVSEALVRAGIPAHRVTRIDNGIQVKQFANAVPPASRTEGITIGTVCRLVPEKGVADLLHSAKDILLRHRNVRFLIAGDGPARREFEELAHKLGISSHVTFSGFCKDMPSTYAAMDIFVLPSWNEGMPMSVIEAMAAGKPVVATFVGSLPQIITNETGFLIAPGDRQTLAKVLAVLIENRELRQSMGREAVIRARKSFSVQTMADSYFRIYEEVCDARLKSHSRHARAQTAV
jgi:glycosyltransferase involved in cell wall biosynthesis